MQLPAAEEVQARVSALRAREADGSLELIGKAHDDPVVLKPADPAWPERFRATRQRIAEALGPVVLRIDHVGSTAIADLAAKPIVDIQVSVADLADEAAYVGQLGAAGWPLRAREPEQRFFREPAGRPRTVHIHVCESGGEWEWRHLLFRDYLRTHPDRAAAYGALKRGLADRYKGDRVSYTEAKGPFIEETLGLAELWAAARGWRP